MSAHGNGEGTRQETRPQYADGSRACRDSLSAPGFSTRQSLMPRILVLILILTLPRRAQTCSASPLDICIRCVSQ